MRQIYNVESPPSSMLYDTTSLCGDSAMLTAEALHYDGVIPYTTTTVTSYNGTYPQPNNSDNTPTHPQSQLQIQNHANTKSSSSSSSSSLLAPISDSLSSAVRMSPKKAGAGGSPSRLSLANLMPSRSALIFATTRSLFLNLLYLESSSLLFSFWFSYDLFLWCVLKCMNFWVKHFEYCVQFVL